MCRGVQGRKLLPQLLSGIVGSSVTSTSCHLAPTTTWDISLGPWLKSTFPPLFLLPPLVRGLLYNPYSPSLKDCHRYPHTHKQYSKRDDPYNNLDSKPFHYPLPFFSCAPSVSHIVHPVRIPWMAFNITLKLVNRNSVTWKKRLK